MAETKEAKSTREQRAAAALEKKIAKAKESITFHEKKLAKAKDDLKKFEEQANKSASEALAKRLLASGKTEEEINAFLNS